MNVRAEAGCVYEHDITKMKPLHAFDVDINLDGEIVTRKMVKVVVKEIPMLADKITGTLYNPKTGKCNSARIYIEKVYKN
jgi:hypothetical protein